MIVCRYRGTMIGLSQETLIPGHTYWVAEPVGRHHSGTTSAGARLTLKLPVRVGSTLPEALGRVLTDLETLEVVP